MEVLIFAAITTAMVLTSYYIGKDRARLEILIAVNRLLLEITSENTKELRREEENLKREEKDNKNNDKTLINVLGAGERFLESSRIHTKILKEFAEIVRRWKNGK